MPPRRQGWDDDDDDDFHDRRPVFKGTRNYESFGSSLGEKIGDAVTTVAQAAGNLKEQLEREARKNDALDKLGSKFNNLGESIRQTDAGNVIQKEWAKVTSAASKAIEERRLAAEREKDQARSHSKMPPGCYCDMRGYPCPMHKGHEKWRTSTVYQQHLLYNSDGKEEGARQSSSGQSSANGASGKDSAELDEMLAQLVSMGFDPERVVEVLSKHKSLQSATNALLDAPEPERQPPPADPPRVAISEFIGAAPKVPPPKPPKPEPESLLLFDEPIEQPQPPRNFAAELFLMSSTPLPSSTPPPVAAPPPSGTSTFASTGPAAARPPSVPFTPAGAGPMPGAPPRTGGNGGAAGGTAGGTPHAGFPPQCAQPAGASNWPPYPEKPAAPVQADPTLPAGWHACVHASSGLPYYFNTSTQQSQWEHPALPATAANGARASQAPAQVQPPSHGAHTPQMPPQVQPPAHGAYAPPSPRQAQTPSPHGAYAPQGQFQPPAHAPQAPHHAQAVSSYAAPAPSAPAGVGWGSPSAAPQQVSAATPELPPPWHACVHPSTGIPYYFNTETQQSQWEYPGVRAPIASGASPTPNGNSSRPT
ncbi:hypothetical protein AB1Y20_018017 [Prymnesium parvum]|uniref:Uncharacterized protein n=1 Tax=Prymnesium parvum TaxID=97485 RepID=A0AB34JQK3_PRYPA